MSGKIIIPTPVKCGFTGKEISFYGFEVVNSSLAAPYALKMGDALLRKNSPAKLIFAKLAHENKQAYKIFIKKDGVAVEGASEVAFIYAMSTLLQLAEIKGEKIILPEGEVFDYPQFKHRGVNWNLFVECRGWSQDAGDGLDSFIERFVSGLDTLAFFKLNAAFVDGVGWNKERFSGYAELMQKLNAEARKRGVKLIFVGYNAGYGAQWYDFDGPKFENRKSYPDGAIYSCLGHPHFEKSNTMGTCLSNKSLLEAKKNNLNEFTRIVEPGMLYLHGLDVSSHEHAKSAWLKRCPECRKRWPNDDVTASDGMAGAFAEFYDELYDSVSSVKNPESGYDAAKDCIANMVSPNYTSYNESDEEWKYHLAYFKTLSSCLKNKNIHLALREQFFNNATSDPRFKQLRRAVGKKQKLSVIYFSSGSTFYNSLPVTADPVCIKYFHGMDAVIAGSGNAFQEPRQVIFSEYMWNPEGTAFKVELPKRASNNRFLPYYHDLTNGRILSDAVMGKNGLLEIACKKLYGKKAAKLATHTQCPEPFSEPVLESFWRTKTFALTPLSPLCNEMLPGYIFSVFNKPWKGTKTYWHEELTEYVIEYAKCCEKFMPIFAGISEKAANNCERAAALCKSELPLKPAMRRKHLERMAKTYLMGASLAEFTRRWLQILISAYENVRHCKDSSATQSAIKELCNELTSFIEPVKALSDKMIDPKKGDLGHAMRIVEFIISDISNISHTLNTGKYSEMKKDSWW